MRIHILEDDPDIADLLLHNLRSEAQVACYSDGRDGLLAIRRDNPDMVLLDLMLPGLEGLEVCRQLKASSATRRIPIIIVSAKNRESDIVLGLGLGADDYVTKPFSIAELIARVKSLHRRCLAINTVEADKLSFHGLEMDKRKFTASIDGQALVLTATEFRLLFSIARHPGCVFSREMLKSLVIGDDVIVMDHNIDVHIGTLRRKLGLRRELIETMRGVGYRFKDV